MKLLHSIFGRYTTAALIIITIAISVALWFDARIGAIFAVMWVPFMYVQLVALHKAMLEQEERQALALKEAGAAITDTLQIAFGGLKKVTIAATKLQSRVSELDKRLHQLDRAYRRSESVDARQEALNSINKETK